MDYKITYFDMADKKTMSLTAHDIDTAKSVLSILDAAVIYVNITVSPAL